MARTRSELLFERLLRNKGYRFKKGEDYFQKGAKCPDYYMITSYGDLICEVKEFIEPEIHKMIQKQRVRTFSSKRILNPIKNKIKAASTQLKPYTKYDVPMIVILANPYRYFVDLSNEEILSAMYGEIGLSIPLRDEENPEWFFGRGGVLTNQKEYISAICVLEYVPIRSRKIDKIAADIKAKHGDDEMNFDLILEMASEFLVEVAALKKKGFIIERKALRLRIFRNVSARIKLNKEIFCSKYDEIY